MKRVNVMVAFLFMVVIKQFVNMAMRILAIKTCPQVLFFLDEVVRLACYLLS